MYVFPPVRIAVAFSLLIGITAPSYADPISGSAAITYLGGPTVVGDPLAGVVAAVQPPPGSGALQFFGFNPYSPPLPFPWEFASTPFIVAGGGPCTAGGVDSTGGCLVSSTSAPGAVDSVTLGFSTLTRNVPDDVDEILGPIWVAGMFLIHLDPTFAGSFGTVTMGMTTFSPLSITLGSGSTGSFSGPSGFTFGFALPGLSPVTMGPWWLTGGWAADFGTHVIADGGTLATTGGLVATVDPAFIEIMPLDFPLAPSEFLRTLPRGGMSFTTSVPEPAALLLLAPALTIAMRRRRRRLSD